MNISVIGTGYVGLVTGTCFSEMGNQVYCVDIIEEKIRALQNGIIPIYEPGLQELVCRNLKDGRLKFTTDLKLAIENSDICFIAVGTPSQADGSADLSNFNNAVESISENIKKYIVIVNKSTVPVGTGNKVKKLIQEKLFAKQQQVEFDIVSNPEFLKEGTAVEDFMRPDRIIVGTESVKARQIMHQLYEPFVRNQHPIYDMDIISAEMSKYAANAFLATKISFMNELAKLCDKVGGDINNVRLGIGSDQRIGMQFLYAGAGFGGSCFPKDVRELVSLGQRNDVDMSIVKSVNSVNEKQKEYLVEKIINKFGENLNGLVFGIWGLSFKPLTDDMREAASLKIIEKLINQGAKLRVYDPEAMENAKQILNNSVGEIKFCNSMMEVSEDADALILITEWRQFRQPDFDELRIKLRKPIIFDGRNQYDPRKMYDLGFEYYCIGRRYYEK